MVKLVAVIVPPAKVSVPETKMTTKASLANWVSVCPARFKLEYWTVQAYWTSVVFATRVSDPSIPAPKR